MSPRTRSRSPRVKRRQITNAKRSTTLEMTVLTMLYGTRVLTSLTSSPNSH